MSNITEFSLLDNASGYGTKKNPYSVSPLWVYGNQIITIKTNGTGFLGVNFTDMKQRVYADQTPYHVISIHVNGVLVKADISRLTETKDYGAYIPVSGDSEVRIIFSGSDNALTYSGNFTVYLDGSVGSDSVSPTTTTAEPEPEDEGILIGKVEALQHCKLYETRISGDDASSFALRNDREIYFLGDTSEPAVYKYVIENVNQNGEVDATNETFEIIECVDNPCYDPGTVTIDDKLPIPEIVAIQHVGECGWRVTMKIKGDTGYTLEDFPSFGIEVWDSSRSTRYFLNGIVEMPEEGTNAVLNGGVGRDYEFLSVIVPINTYWVSNSIRTRFNHESGAVSNWSKWSDVSVYISQPSVINTEVTYTCEDADTGLFDIYANLNLEPPYVNIYIYLEESEDRYVERITAGITSYFGDFTGGSTTIPIARQAVNGCVEISDTLGHGWGCYTNFEEAYSVSLCPEEPIVECCVVWHGGCANPPPTTTTLAPTPGPPTIDPGPEGDDDDDCKPPTVPTTTTTTTTTTCDPNWEECEEPPAEECNDLDGIWVCTCANGERYLATPILNDEGCIIEYKCSDVDPTCKPVRPEPRPPTQPPPPPPPPPGGPGTDPDDPDGPTNPPPGNPGGPGGPTPCLGCTPSDPDDPTSPPTGPGGPGGPGDPGDPDDPGPDPGVPPKQPPKQPDTPCPQEEVYQLTLKTNILTENWDGNVTVNVLMLDSEDCQIYADAIGVTRGQSIRLIEITSPTTESVINLGLGCPECFDFCITHGAGQDSKLVKLELTGTKIFPLEEGEEPSAQVLKESSQNSLDGNVNCQECSGNDVLAAVEAILPEFNESAGGVTYTLTHSGLSNLETNRLIGLNRLLAANEQAVITTQKASGPNGSFTEFSKLTVYACNNGKLENITSDVIACELMNHLAFCAGFPPECYYPPEDDHTSYGYYTKRSTRGSVFNNTSDAPALKYPNLTPFNAGWGLEVPHCITCCEKGKTSTNGVTGQLAPASNSDGLDPFNLGIHYNNVACLGDQEIDPNYNGGTRWYNAGGAGNVLPTSNYASLTQPCTMPVYKTVFYDNILGYTWTVELAWNSENDLGTTFDAAGSFFLRDFREFVVNDPEDNPGRCNVPGGSNDPIKYTVGAGSLTWSRGRISMQYSNNDTCTSVANIYRILDGCCIFPRHEAQTNADAPADPNNKWSVSENNWSTGNTNPDGTNNRARFYYTSTPTPWQSDTGNPLP